MARRGALLVLLAGMLFGYAQGVISGALVSMKAALSPAAARILAGRTLTSLYNDRPGWLTEAHRVLDEAVAVAYVWPVDITTDDALTRLLHLNQVRAAEPMRDQASNRTTEQP